MQRESIICSRIHMPFACSIRYTVTHTVLTKADRLITVDTSVADKDTWLRKSQQLAVVVTAATLLSGMDENANM